MKIVEKKIRPFSGVNLRFSLKRLYNMKGKWNLQLHSFRSARLCRDLAVIEKFQVCGHFDRAFRKDKKMLGFWRIPKKTAVQNAFSKRANEVHLL